MEVLLSVFLQFYIEMNQETTYNRLKPSNQSQNQVLGFQVRKINQFEDQSCDEYYSLENLIKRGRQKKIIEEQIFTREEQKKLASLSEALKACFDLRKVIEDHQFGYFFKYPVNPHKLGLPNYWRVIKRPMDLTTIKRKFFIGIYKKAGQFNQDMRLLFTNALTYNSANQEIIQKTNQIFAFYQRQYAEIQKLIFQNKLSQRFKETTSSTQIISKLPPAQVISIFNQTRLQKLGRLLSFLNNRKKRSLLASLKKKFIDLPIEQGQNQRLYFNRLTPDQVYQLLKMAKNITDTDFDVAKLMKIEKKLAQDDQNWEKNHNKNQNKPYQQVESQFQIQDESDE